MEFIVNEAGCRQLAADMLQNMREIVTIADSINSANGTLQSALGEDYDAIATSVRIILGELESARGEMNTIIADMQEYMARVQQARILLNG